MGEGEDMRFESGEASGYMLTAGGRVLHAAAFAGQGAFGTPSG